MHRVIILPQAEADLDQLYDPLLSTIIARIQLLAIFPYLGPTFDNPYKDYRQLTVGIMKVIYRISEDAVEIAFIRHGRRNSPWLM